MKKRTTVYEDKAAKEAKRRKFEEEYRAKHTVQCPYCKKDVLDTMTKCPGCGKELKPAGYRPLSDKQIFRIRLIAFIVCMVIAVAVVYFVVFR